MEDRKINQQTLAGKAGLSPSSLSEIRRGITAPGIDTLADIANALGVDAWELLVNDEETRRKAIERALRSDPQPPANDPIPFIPRKARQAGKGVAAKRVKKSAGAKGADAQSD
jgi:transcriptional regulator with XRE-family HTH domain